MTSKSNPGDVPNQVVAPTPTHVALVSIPMNNAEKPKKISGSFQEGATKDVFLFDHLNLARFLIEMLLRSKKMSTMFKLLVLLMLGNIMNFCAKIMS
ncbi:hypothetical protein Pint_16931 [Pistacia integerrima]|uniref:Uncharacterized protein n=1 Tax=Pistacia integerrima TaxID=434235 RepID=A0ACC0ZDM2_9ROSI|nr:hypothetical protein Pint_16931 [Pistacia integerrima]